MFKCMRVLSSLLWLTVLVSLAFVLILILSAYGLYTGQVPEQISPTKDVSASTPTPRPPTVTPPGYAPIYTGTPPTATPYPGEVRPPVTPEPTFTPLPITDLAKGLPDKDKVVYTIKRSSGMYEVFLIPVNYSGDEKQLMGLGPGDIIVGISALILRPSTPQIERPKLATPINAPFLSPLPTPTQVSLP